MAANQKIVCLLWTKLLSKDILQNYWSNSHTAE